MRPMLRSHVSRIGIGLCLALMAGACMSASFTSQTFANITNVSVNTMETTKFKWGLFTSHYYADQGNTPMLTHERECWMTDAQGKLVMRWLNAGSAWGGAISLWVVMRNWRRFLKK